jgi:quinol monooxygenase YgiN
MVHIFLRHKVGKFDQWKRVFDDHLGMRKAGGELNCRLFYNTDDTSDVVLFQEWTSRVAAETFFNSPQLKKGLEEAGVVGEPELIFVEELHQLRRTAAD